MRKITKKNKTPWQAKRKSNPMKESKEKTILERLAIPYWSKENDQIRILGIVPEKL